MKKLVLIILVLIAITLSGCSAGEREDDAGINIICTIFPHFDWTRQIIGEENMSRFNLGFLLDSGVDMHSYAPSFSDIINIKNADIFIYVGGKSDNWTADVLSDANPDMKVLNLINVLGDDALVFGDFCSDECDEDHDHTAQAEVEFHADEHIWVSLKFAQTICKAIADLLAETDPENAESYYANAENYIVQLSALDTRYQAAADAANVRTLVFADRFPFRYMMLDYDLDFYAAFQGCSAETEASFSTIISLANRINGLGLNYVMVTAASDQAIAQTVIRSTNTNDQKILVMDDMKIATVNTSYLEVMQNNLEVLKEAIS